MEISLWLPPAVAVAIAILGAVWNTGSTSALARRTINQEVTILSGLPDGDTKNALRQTIDDRTAVYLAKRRGPIPDPPWAGGRRRLRDLCVLLTAASFVPLVLEVDEPLRTVAFVGYMVSILGTVGSFIPDAHAGVRHWRRDRWAQRLATARYETPDARRPEV